LQLAEFKVSEPEWEMPARGLGFGMQHECRYH